MEHDDLSYGGSTTDIACKDGWDCAEVDPITTGLGTIYYTGPRYFEGTCDNPQPITCDSRPRADDCDACQYEQCCTFVGLCEDDPNCRAIADCVVGCKNDDACAQRCMTNGDRWAARHLQQAAECIAAKCSDRCGGAASPQPASTH